MKVAWNFDRGHASVGDTVPVKCQFVIQDETGAAQAVVDFIIPETAAQEMLADLASVAKPPTELTIASSLPNGGTL